jgi:hypothetical protein
MKTFHLNPSFLQGQWGEDDDSTRVADDGHASTTRRIIKLNKTEASILFTFALLIGLHHERFYDSMFANLCASVFPKDPFMLVCFS